MRYRRSFSLAGILLLGSAARCNEHDQDWTHYVRIGAYGLRGKDAASIVRDAQATGVFGIEVDNDIPGRYESFVDPTEKLKAIRAVAEEAHKAGNKSFVYIAGTECITAHADKAAHSLAKDHPNWLQRKITGEPASFTSGAAFWISPGDEDVWVSPYAPEWRKTYMEHVREIAATGIDGIYVDIPYWMTHFEGWEDTWASFDDYTVAAFKHSTGLDAKRDLKLGDFSDPNFRKWIDFRISTLTDFVSEISRTARSVNPSIMTIPEIYPGIEEEAVRVGTDVYQMYGVVDAIAHEYEFGEGDHMASSRSQLDWFLYQAGMLSFRAFAENKATWILNYSWDGDKQVDAHEPMKNLAMSQIMVGANTWDAPGHTMAGSNDAKTRREIFTWIAQHEETFYAPRRPMHPVGVYFSPASRNYDAKNFLPSYRGILLLLLQNHLELQIVTPRTLANFNAQVLVLPSVSAYSDDEKARLREFSSKGGKLVFTGVNASGLSNDSHASFFAQCPGKDHLEQLQKNFEEGSRLSSKEFLSAIVPASQLTIDAPPTVAINIAEVDGHAHIFMANFTGLVPHKNAVPTTLQDVTISTRDLNAKTLQLLPFLGTIQTLTGRRIGDRVVFILPSLERGAVAWIQ
jgi:hypothetical protein